jgi:voltage-gated potassium channel
MTFRKRIYEILDVAKAGDNLSRGFDIFIITLIALNIIALNLESVESIRAFCPKLFTIFECISIMIFSIEYFFRIWSCVENQSYKRSIIGRLRFAITPLALIDLFAILPFYLPFAGFDLRFLRAARMMRISRIAKVGRYSQSLQTLQRVLGAKKEQLISAVLILLLLLIMASSLMYFAEKDIQPESFSSIPASMWWAVTTLTTVGYGDIYPVSQLGKLMASVIAILGIGMFALPTGIIGAGFVEEIERNKGKPKICPNCGKQM